MNEKVVFSGDMRLKKTIDGQPNVIYEKSLNEHDRLIHRDYGDQHPIEAITGLAEELADIEEQLASVTIEEVDPTVPAWAKSPTKPTYTAAEVGALPDDTEIPVVPTDVSAFNNDAGYLTEHQDISSKQDTISDLATIRAGAALGATAVQTESDPTVPAWAKASTKPSYTAQEVGALPNTTAIPSKTSDLTNDSGFITSADVPEGAAASTTMPKMDGTAAVGTETAFARGDHRHPSDTSRVPTSRTVNGKALSADITLDASDVGALPDDTVIPVIPANVSAFTNDAGYLTSYTETDPTVPNWAKQANKPTYTASEVGALPSTTVIPIVPTAVSAFANDSGYLTESTLPVYDGTVDPSGTVDPYPGYDVAMIINFDSYTGAIVKGVFSEVMAKLEAHTPISAYFFGYSQSNSETNIYTDVRIYFENDWINFGFLVGGTSWTWHSDGRFHTED